jgi:hypothetical protein
MVVLACNRSYLGDRDRRIVVRGQAKVSETSSEKQNLKREKQKDWGCDSIGRALT